MSEGLDGAWPERDSRTPRGNLGRWVPRVLEPYVPAMLNGAAIIDVVNWMLPAGSVGGDRAGGDR
jgi:hypothetical protein